MAKLYRRAGNWLASRKSQTLWKAIQRREVRIISMMLGTRLFACRPDELLRRDKLSIDLFCIKRLTDTNILPAPEIIVAEITDDLETALEQFAKISSRLSAGSPA